MLICLEKSMAMDAVFEAFSLCPRVPPKHLEVVVVVACWLHVL